MLYVSDIMLNMVRLPYFRSNKGIPDGLQLIISDSVTGVSGSVEGDAIYEIGSADCLGLVIVGPFCAIIVHTRRSAQFMKYISRTRGTESFHRGFRYDLYDMRMVRSVDKSPESVTLDITNIGMHFIDMHHSMVTVSISDQYKLMSLYDFCCLLNRELGFSIMQFKQVCFFEAAENKGELLRFIHNKEANKFFSKMALLGTSSKQGVVYYDVA